jgi:hypothetical protein
MLVTTRARARCSNLLADHDTAELHHLLADVEAGPRSKLCANINTPPS